jgi:hypothetical protein
MKEIDGYVFYDDDDNDSTTINLSRTEEITYRSSFLDTDATGSQFVNHIDVVVEEQSSTLNLPEEHFNFPPGYRRVVHVEKGIGDNRNSLGTGSALPESLDEEDNDQLIQVEKRIVQKVGDLFDRNFFNNVEVKESTIPNVINKVFYLIYIIVIICYILIIIEWNGAVQQAKFRKKRINYGLCR